jgi:hypothetical protein
VPDASYEVHGCEGSSCTRIWVRTRFDRACHVSAGYLLANRSRRRQLPCKDSLTRFLSWCLVPAQNPFTFAVKLADDSKPLPPHAPSVPHRTAPHRTAPRCSSWPGHPRPPSTQLLSCRYLDQTERPPIHPDRTAPSRIHIYNEGCSAACVLAQRERTHILGPLRASWEGATGDCRR